MNKRIKIITWWIFAICSTLIGLYPIIYFLIDRRFGLLSFKSQEILSSISWNIGFYGHIVLGGLALTIGWIQFSKKIRLKNLNLHRRIGKVYTLAALISGVCGLYIAFFATGGFISTLGFGLLAVLWIWTSFMGYRSAKKGNIQVHENFMIISYSCCFAAVTLRIWLPILVAIFGEFIVAYQIVAWLCWVPNLFVGLLIIRYRMNMGNQK